MTVVNRQGVPVVIAYLCTGTANETARPSMKNVRAEVWAKTDGHCWHCKKRLNPFSDFHVDHVMPRSMGGSDLIENLVPSCAACNLSKGAKHPSEWEGARL